MSSDVTPFSGSVGNGEEELSLLLLFLELYSTQDVGGGESTAALLFFGRMDDGAIKALTSKHANSSNCIVIQLDVFLLIFQ